MTGRSPREEQRRKSRRFAILISIFAILLLVAGGGAFVIAVIRNPPIDEATGCLKKGDPTVRWAVLLDATDSFGAVQRKWIVDQFNEIKKEVPRHGWLALYALPQDPVQALEPLVALCNPGTGEGVSPLWGNPRAMRFRWEKGFDAPLRREFDVLLNREASRSSPIMETIQAVNVGALSTASTAEIPKRLYIFSDMLQHTADYSHYGGSPPSFEGLPETGFFKRVRTDLSGVEATLFYARRDDAKDIQGRSHINFWDRYFSSLGGKLVRVKWIEG